MVILRFLDSVYHIVSGRLGAHGTSHIVLPCISGVMLKRWVVIAASWGEALQLGVSLNIHREASYAGLGEYFFKCSSSATSTVPVLTLK